MSTVIRLYIGWAKRFYYLCRPSQRPLTREQIVARAYASGFITGAEARQILDIVNADA